MTYTIAMSNEKGGVAKTTSTLSLGAALAELNYRVLLIDLDPQANLSLALGLETGESIVTSANILIENVALHSAIRKTDIKNLDLVPSSFRIETAEQFLPMRTHYLSTLHDALKADTLPYDYILFDCPPNILRASQCGIFAANEIYVPANPDALSLIGFTLLVEKLQKFHSLSASFRTGSMGNAAHVKGIIFNSIKTGSDIEVPKMRMQLRLNQFKSAKRVAPTAKIFESQVRDAMIVRRAVTLGLPVVLVSLDQAQEGQDNVVNDYRKVAAELVRQQE